MENAKKMESMETAVNMIVRISFAGISRYRRKKYNTTKSTPVIAAMSTISFLSAGVRMFFDAPSRGSRFMMLRSAGSNANEKFMKPSSIMFVQRI